MGELLVYLIGAVLVAGITFLGTYFWLDKRAQSRLSLAQAEEIVSGKKVEMRLGTVELAWSQPVLANMREYVRTLASYAPSRQKTRGRKP